NMAHDLDASLNGATPEQQRVIARWHDVATLLPQALPLQTPAAYLRERLLNRIAKETQQTPIEIAVEESSLKEMAEQEERKVLTFDQPRLAEPRTARWLLIAATALLTFTAGYLFKRNAELRGKVDDIVSPRTRIISMVGDEAPQANAKVIWDTKA